MEDNKKMLELMEEIEKNSRKQLWTSRILCGCAAVAMICCAGMLLTVLRFMPQVHDLMGQMQTVLGNLEKTTDQLATADLKSMVESVDALVTTGQESLKQTMDKLNQLDFETLNTAIETLGNVVEKLQKIVNIFG